MQYFQILFSKPNLPASPTPATFMPSSSRRRHISTMKRTSKALVTGGAGFIGSHLVQALLAQGTQVTVIDDMSNGLESNLDLFRDQITFIKASILDQTALNQAAEDCNTIFHLAAVSNVAQTLEQPLFAHAINATGTMNVLEAARSTKSHLVFSSSAATYGDTLIVPTPENAPQNPISLYGSQKLLGEHYIRNYCHLFDLSAVCLRYFNVYGPRQRPDSPYSGVISIFTERARQNLPITIHGDGLQTRDFIHVRDVVRANIAAAQATKIKGQAFNVCTGKSTSIKHLAELTINLTASTSEISYSSPREGDIRSSLGISDLAKSELNFKSETVFEEGLANLITTNPNEM
jgi:UDP-glucose 4-epimerase